jgi:hypothetical protein
MKYLAVYRCPGCHAIEMVEQKYRLHLGESCRCPKCGTFRVTKLKERDHIDKMHTGLLHWLEKLAGGNLYHCCFCRVQFHDRRRMRPLPRAAQPAEPQDAKPDTAPPTETLESQSEAKPVA